MDAPTNGNGNGMVKEAAKNINTILLWATVTALGFIGLISYNSSVSLAELKGQMMTRTELESKFIQFKAEIETRLLTSDTARQAIDKDLQSLKLDLAHGNQRR